MVRIASWALAAIALGAASPALASDFSGIGRAIWWLIFAVMVLIGFSIILYRSRKHGLVAWANALLALVTATMLAPSIYVAGMKGFGPIFSPMPGMLIAAIEGSIKVLFPVPVLSMLVFTVVIFLMLQRRGRGTVKTDEVCK